MDWIRNRWNQGLAFAKQNKGKTVAVATVASVFITGTALANHYYNANSTTLYHVYLDGQEVGTVDHPDRVHHFVQQEIDKQSHNDIKPRLESEIQFKEALSLKEKPQTEETLNVLSSKIQLKVAAQSIMIDGKVVGYVSDQQEINSIFDEIKKKYGPLPLPSDKSKTVSAASAPENTLVVKFKEGVQTKAEDVSPEKVLTGEQLKTLIEKGTLQQLVHTVKEGDCLGCIAQQYGIQTQDILRNNPELKEDSLLQLGQTLNVTAAKPLLTVQSIEKKQQDVVLDYAIEMKTNDTMYRGDSKVIQAGEEGLKKVTYQIIKENGVETEKKILNEEVLKEPVSKIIEKGTKVKPDRGSGSFIWPTNGGSITSGYGPRWGRKHEGIDIAGVSNRSIKAADNGRVVSAGWKGNYGNCVIIDHGNGYRTLYGHMSSISVAVGDVVEQGEKLGVMGSTGDSTGVHLHFEVLKNGVNRNPMEFYRG